ncbi:hypothetical protein QBC35DRAFT_155332 [Podospora australis]|uniref:Uncharacterized protein n=1 Tax=Podospora australis TaxID=1536484 RepID=A0AAN6WXA5_9PEZI|nr:hypothetical protein QBC35DRAFT_155332 [Podospora australis]
MGSKLAPPKRKTGSSYVRVFFIPSVTSRVCLTLFARQSCWCCCWEGKKKRQGSSVPLESIEPERIPSLLDANRCDAFDSLLQDHLGLHPRYHRRTVRRKQAQRTAVQRRRSAPLSGSFQQNEQGIENMDWYVWSYGIAYHPSRHFVTSDGFVWGWPNLTPHVKSDLPKKRGVKLLPGRREKKKKEKKNGIGITKNIRCPKRSR